MTKSDPRERLLQTAERLFYAQGYRATGINQLLEEAGVAKASFYHHFKSKEELLIAFLRRVHETWLEQMRQIIDGKNSTEKRVRALFGAMRELAESPAFRGCPFMNTKGECGDERAIGEVVQWHQDSVREFWRTEVLGDGTAALADELYLLYVGAMTLTQMHEDPWPIAAALRALKRSTVGAR